MINTDNTVILVIDLQEKLVNMLPDDKITAKASKLLAAASLLSIPIIVTEQYPKGLGATVDELKQNAAPDTKYFEKTAFSAAGEPGFLELLAGYKRKNVLIFGIEGHVCVYQTAIDLNNSGYNVELVKDLTASRSNDELLAAIDKMKQSGIGITTFEIALFELLKTSKHPEFKGIQTLIK